VFEKTFYTEAEIAALYGLTGAYLRKLRSRQAGPVFVRIGDRMIRYRRVDIDRWLATAAVEVIPKRAS